MLEKGKISAFQMGLMIYPLIYATAILFVPTITGKYAGRDAWISPILGSLNGFFTAFIAYQLHKLYPKETIIQYSRHIIGRIPGKLLGFAYLFFFLYLSGFILREYADFIITSFLPKTPLIVVIGGMVLVSALAVHGGVEVLGRAFQLFILAFIIPIPIFVVPLLKDLDPKNMFPIMEHEIMPAILGAAAPQAWFSEVFLISMLFPFLINREKGMKWSMISVFAVMLSLVSINLLTIFLFGKSVSSNTFPVFNAIRYISLGPFFEHLEAGIIAIWVLGVFMKISVFYYALVLGTAQWLHLSDYRPIVVPLGFLATLFSIWEFSNLQEQFEFSGKSFPFYTSFMLTVIPVLLLLIAVIRKRNRQKKEIPKNSAS
ncbi:GerAB/ArcD/ProY family transporter [Aneurinibacillus tyrosinisolvens]|uniref:GerAB/ArcD/ProY family transporter n=1 Tax=Aneurinibacillus tyrosinisolvens TaxID=1443435 RepID=UPI00063F5C22|nr:endospore germination permease [Aneurinibacillus tyrosinisolvens]